jgi:hypothetical protein
MACSGTALAFLALAFFNYLTKLKNVSIEKQFYRIRAVSTSTFSIPERYI